MRGGFLTMKTLPKWDADDKLLSDYEDYLESMYSLVLSDEAPYPEDELEEF